MTDMAQDTKFQLRCGVAQLESWRASAERMGWPLSLWMRRALDEQVALDRAVAAEEKLVEPEESGWGPAGETVDVPSGIPGVMARIPADLAAKLKPDPRRR